MSIASLSPNRDPDSMPRERGPSPRRVRARAAKAAGSAQWTDADASGRCRRQPPSTSASGTRRLQPGDGLGFQMMRREADDDAGFPLFISPSPDATVTSTATTTTAAAAKPPYDIPVATGKHGVHQATRNKHPHKTDPPRKPRTGSARLECHACGTSETPEWRCGPDGLGTLCNVCGLVLAKKQRRRSAV